MIITCPNCNKQFKIENSLIPDEGRDLQCGSCNHVWFHKIEEDDNELLKLKEEIVSKEIEIKRLLQFCSTISFFIFALVFNAKYLTKIYPPRRGKYIVNWRVGSAPLYFHTCLPRLGPDCLIANYDGPG